MVHPLSLWGRGDGVRGRLLLVLTPHPHPLSPTRRGERFMRRVVRPALAALRRRLAAADSGGRGAPCFPPRFAGRDPPESWSDAASSPVFRHDGESLLPDRGGGRR